MLRGTALFLLLAATTAAQQDHGFGAVTPVPLPNLKATDENGREIALRDLLAGRRTALQFIFTSCPTTCPLLGSLFQRVDRSLPPTAAEPQLLSITVDPAQDSPTRLAAWLQTFHHTPRWKALRLPPDSLRQLLRAFNIQPGPAVAHSLQIFLVDAEGRYIARTTALPTSIQVVTALQETPQHSVPSRSGFSATVDGEPIAAHAALCANCHGSDYTGRTEGKAVAPSLQRDALLTAKPRRGGPPSAYSEESFCQALQSGRDPAGVQFSSIMPRYQMSPQACRTLWNFLTTPR